MEEFDFVARDQFGVVKFLTFLSIFILASILQYRFPHQNSLPAVLKNWRVNLSLAGMNACRDGEYLRRMPMRTCAPHQAATLGHLRI